jgi:hypothetical protein
MLDQAELLVAKDTAMLQGQLGDIEGFLEDFLRPFSNMRKLKRKGTKKKKKNRGLLRY